MTEQENSRKFVLVTGRSQEQTKGMHAGKTGSSYRDAVSVAALHPDTLAELGMGEGSRLCLKTSAGEAIFVAKADRGLPENLVFVPMGPVVNVLVPEKTAGCGMPPFKGLEVEVTGA
ncbi:MAG: molybdopterin dinucleotide binding domain-containing protein [Thermovirgaceae bacterium]